MIPPVLHVVWLGDKPEPDHMLDSFRALNPKWMIMKWDEWCAQEILHIDIEREQKRFPMLAGLSNLIRLHAVYQFGGIYADYDFVHHKPLESLRVHQAFACEQEPGRLCNAFFGAELTHPWLRFQISDLDSCVGLAPYWGVDLMTKHSWNVTKHELERLPQHIAYPYRWDTPPEARIVHPDSIVEHLWDYSWKD